MDLEDLSSLQCVASEALAVHGHIDVLINNAGISGRGTVLETTLETDIRVFTINVLGTVALTKGQTHSH